ncbi:MAG: hypothetical protein ACYDAG_05490 [Chloroflexota bacterium]
MARIPDAPAAELDIPAWRPYALKSMRAGNSIMIIQLGDVSPS